MRSALLFLAALALLVLVGNPSAEAGKLTPEQKRGVKLIKDARAVGRSFRKAQGPVNKAFVRASKKLARELNRGRLDAATAFADWQGLYRDFVADRLARRDDALGRYEALYVGADLVAGKNPTSTQLGSEAFQRGIGLPGARTACDQEFQFESAAAVGACTAGFGSVAAACDDAGSPVAGVFGDRSAFVKTRGDGAPRGSILGVTALATGELTVKVETAEFSQTTTMRVRLYDLGIPYDCERGGTNQELELRVVLLPDRIEDVLFVDLPPGEYGVFVNGTCGPENDSPPRFTDYREITVPAKPEQDPGGGGDPGKSSCTGFFDGNPIGTPDVVGFDLKMKGANVEAIQVLCTDRDEPAARPTLFCSLLHAGAGFPAGGGKIEIAAGPGGDGEATADATYDPDGIGGASEHIAITGTLTVENLKALTDLSKPGTATISFDGMMFELRGGGGTKTLTYTITLSNTDLPAFGGGSKQDTR